jgi:hypothetical protein
MCNARYGRRLAQGDLHDWTAVLNRLDNLLAGILNRTPALLVTRPSEPAPVEPSAAVVELIVGYLRFSAVLLSNSLNKEIYASVEVQRLSCPPPANTVGALV